MKRLISLFSITLISSLSAMEQVQWLDFTKPAVSPVSRVCDKFISGGNTIYTDKQTTIFKLTYQPVPGENYYGICWETMKKKLSAKQACSVIRKAFPPLLQGKTLGVEVELFTKTPLSVELRPLRGGRRDFWGYNKRQLHIKHNVLVEPQTSVYRIMWDEIGCVPSTVGAVEFLRSDFGKLWIKRITLLCADSATAEKFRLEKQKTYHNAISVMTSWIKSCGINLKSLAGKMSDRSIEKLAWQAIWVFSIEQQIDNWLAIADANGIKTQLKQLTPNLKTISGLLEKGENAEKKIKSLQNKINHWINFTIERIPVAKRRWKTEKEGFKRPDGRDYRFCAAHFFRAQYPPSSYPLDKIKPDLRYLAGLGFNGLRLHVVWSLLEPKRGVFDTEYLKMLRRIMSEAERYGIAVGIDLHWPYPEWFVRGNPEFKTLTAAEMKGDTTPYQWPEALVDTWGRFAESIKDIPNIIAFEVPTNEPRIASYQKGVKKYPELTHSWNKWLRKQYKSEDALNAVWGAAGFRYALKKNESWNKDSIQPLGFNGDPNPEYAYSHNPRFWDHVRWSAYLQKKTTGDIMRAIRKSIPNAWGMMQYSIGDIWDYSPIPVNYKGIQTLSGDHVLAGTHYGLRSPQLFKALSLNKATYDSEQQMENNFAAVSEHVRRGGGFTAFAFHYHGNGGMLFCDDQWHLKPEVAYLPATLRWARKYQSEKKEEGRKIALINNTRIECAWGTSLADLYKQLPDLGYRVALFEGLKVVDHPEVLDSYDYVITHSAYMDVNLLKVLNEHYKGSVLLFGRLDCDAWCRPAALARELKKQGLFLRDDRLSPLDEKQLGKIELSGSWDCFFAKDSTFPPKGILSKNADGKWRKMIVPGKWGEMGITGSLKYFLGNVWCKKTILVPKSWKGKQLWLKMGAIDDLDYTYFNGELIGKTLSDTPNYWLAPRKYKIKESLVKFGFPNEILVCVNNNYGDGGIYKTPVVIESEEQTWLITESGNSVIAPVANATLLKQKQLLDNTEIMGFFKLSDREERIPAILKQGRWSWYGGSKLTLELLKKSDMLH